LLWFIMPLAAAFNTCNKHAGRESVRAHLLLLHIMSVLTRI